MRVYVAHDYFDQNLTEEELDELTTQHMTALDIWG